MIIVIAGAGASGLFCAGLLGQQGHDVVIIDNGTTPGRKFLLAGGGRCNFTNLNIGPQNYISDNSHFCKSALSRYTQWDFIDLLTQYGITYVEREHGQLFCKNSSKEILDMLLTECRKGRVKIITENTVESVTFDGKQFQILLSSGHLSADKLIVATGGLSLPKTGATPTAYKIADSFDIPIVPVRAGLVPLTLDKPDLDLLEPLSGVSLPVKISLPGISFKEKLLFTHKGLSGPAILQISNYWLPGQILKIDLLPNEDIDTILREAPSQKQIKTILASYIPKSLCDYLVKVALIPDISIGCLTKEMRQQTADNIHKWCIKPNGTEGYRTAEVTLGGVDVNALSSKTMATTKIKDLYFIGEAVDVTGHLGGYNLQWCWSSAWACADAIKKHDR